MTALKTGIAGFVETTVVNEFPATGHGVTTRDRSNV